MSSTLLRPHCVYASISRTTISLQTQLTWWNPASFLSQLYYYESYIFNYNMIACRLQAGIWLLTHRGPVTHICTRRLAIIGSDNGLSPGRCQAIIWTNDGILLIGRLGTNFSESLIKIHTFSFKKMHFKMSPENIVHFVSASMCLWQNEADEEILKASEMQ